MPLSASYPFTTPCSAGSRASESCNSRAVGLCPVWLCRMFSSLHHAALDLQWGYVTCLCMSLWTWKLMFRSRHWWQFNCPQVWCSLKKVCHTWVNRTWCHEVSAGWCYEVLFKSSMAQYTRGRAAWGRGCWLTDSGSCFSNRDHCCGRPWIAFRGHPPHVHLWSGSRKDSTVWSTLRCSGTFLLPRTFLYQKMRTLAEKVFAYTFPDSVDSLSWTKPAMLFRLALLRTLLYALIIHISITNT